jgi:hypothetical protein
VARAHQVRPGDRLLVDGGNEVEVVKIVPMGGSISMHWRDSNGNETVRLLSWSQGVERAGEHSLVEPVEVETPTSRPHLLPPLPMEGVG